MDCNVAGFKSFVLIQKLDSFLYRLQDFETFIASRLAYLKSAGLHITKKVTYNCLAPAVYVTHKITVLQKSRF